MHSRVGGRWGKLAKREWTKQKDYVCTVVFLGGGGTNKKVMCTKTDRRSVHLGITMYGAISV